MREDKKNDTGIGNTYMDATNNEMRGKTEEWEGNIFYSILFLQIQDL